jgi:hypothetical protein
MCLIVFLSLLNIDEASEKSFGMDRLKSMVHSRININNYVPPPNCADCPGEGGAGVYLSVTCSKSNILFFVSHLKSFLIKFRKKSQ